MKFKILFFIAFFSCISCKESTEVFEKVIVVCNEPKPLENFTFLKEAKNTIDRIDCAGRSSITQYTYNLETVFEVIICDQVSDHQILVYNCSGEVVCTFGGISGENTCPDFEKEATDKIILYGN